MRRALVLTLLASLACLSSARADDVVDPPELDPGAMDTACLSGGAAGPEEPEEPGESEAPEGTDEPEPELEESRNSEENSENSDPADSNSDAPLPHGREIGALSGSRCLGLLEAHRIPFDRVAASEAEGVAYPVRLRGPIGGIHVRSRGGNELHEVVDCRLVLALIDLAPALRAEGVVAVEHYSIYRPGAHVRGTGRVSGHAHGLAIDAAFFHLRGDRVLTVLDDWGDRTRRADPCARYEDGEDASRLRRIACHAARSESFQVVLTPHFDRAHHNHLHLEVRPGVGWSYLH